MKLTVGTWWTVAVGRPSWYQDRRSSSVRQLAPFQCHLLASHVVGSARHDRVPYVPMQQLQLSVPCGGDKVAIIRNPPRGPIIEITVIEFTWLLPEYKKWVFSKVMIFLFSQNIVKWRLSVKFAENERLLTETDPVDINLKSRNYS